MYQPSEYQPPDDIWEVNRRLRVDEPLDGENDPRWVDTGAARGEYSHHRLYRMLGVNPDGAAPRLGTSPDRSYYLFCGHRGCGKSTELRRVRNDLHSPTLYYVVFADAAQELDVNNLRYQDILLHLASKLVEQLRSDDIGIERVHLQRIEDWFTQRVEMQQETRELALEIKAGAGVETGLPFIGKVFAKFSDVFKTNSTYKTELRRTLQNYFTDFADAFNHLIEAAEEAVRAAGMGRRILFVIDGTDLLRDEDARAFFIADVHQLQQVRGLFIYCAPIHLIYEGTTIEQSFDRIFSLPMIKVENADGSPNEIGRKAMRQMLYRRAAPNLFDDGVADALIEQSGGHPRDFLRLLRSAFMFAERNRFDHDSVRRAARDQANVFRRFLDTEDYQILATIDSNPKKLPHSDRTRHLLYNLALLEYNDFFWRSHPVIRTTDAYRIARAALDSAGDG